MNNIYRDLLYKILRIRMIEEAIALHYPKGKMRCPVHLSIGQEAIAVMACEHLRQEDLVVSTHRAHAHYLAKGGDLNRFIAELYGKKTGATQGRGGSMNLSDLSVGFVASTAIVGNTIPLGVGLALAQQLKKSQAITCIFLGDAAIEEGAFYESINFAALKTLPVLFICENNLYSVNTPLSMRQPADREIYRMARGMGAKTAKIDGNNVLSSFKPLTDVFEDIRNNSGPWFLECPTYRFKIHCGPEDDTHLDRPQSEFNDWASRDPVPSLSAALLASKHITEVDIHDWRSAIQHEIEAAFDFAEHSAWPDAKESLHYRYADNQLAWLSDRLNQEEAAI